MGEYNIKPRFADTRFEQPETHFHSKFVRKSCKNRSFTYTYIDFLLQLKHLLMQNCFQAAQTAIASYFDLVQNRKRSKTREAASMHFGFFIFLTQVSRP